MKSFQKDERGVGHVVLVLLAVVVLAGIGFAGYRVIKDKDSSSSSSNLSSEEVAKIENECNDELGDEDFCKFASSFSGTQTYSAVMETSGANGSSSSVMKVDGDDSQVTTTSDGQVVADYISLGDSTYFKDITDGSWTKTTIDTPETEDITDEIDFDFDESDVPEADRTQYKQLGKEACGDYTCFKYQIIDPSDTSTEQFLYFDDDDYLLRKWVFTGGEGTTTMTFTYEDVTITEPSPIKE